MLIVSPWPPSRRLLCLVPATNQNSDPVCGWLLPYWQIGENYRRLTFLHPSGKRAAISVCSLISVGRESAHDGGPANPPSHGLPGQRPAGNLPVTGQGSARPGQARFANQEQKRPF